MTTHNGGSQGSDVKTKVLHIQPCTTPTQPTEPEPTEPEPTEPEPTEPEPTEPEPTEPEPTEPEPGTPGERWNWDWEYTAPTCTALIVDYPAAIPAGQANDVNVRFETPTGQLTLNFHHNTGTGRAAPSSPSPTTRSGPPV